MYNNYLIIGAARSGLSSAKYLLKHNKNVIISDMNSDLFQKTKEMFPKMSEDKLIFGRQPNLDELSVDAIILSPGIPHHIPPVIQAKEKGIPVIGEIELAYMATEAKIIGITGTNGKTTTTSLIGHLVESKAYKTKCVGNIGLPMIEVCEEMSRADVLVSELSSFQLDTIDKFHVDIAILLNLTPDHLDRHKTLENYLVAKANILKNQNENDMAILNKDDKAIYSLRNQIKALVWEISQLDEVERGIFVKDGYMVLRDGEDTVLLTCDDLQIKGKHNVENAMASALAAYLFGIPLNAIQERLKSFSGVAHRMEFVRAFEGRKYINDSKGTNPDATMKALESYKEPIVVILGGKNKGSDFTELATLVKKTCHHAVVLGEAKNDIVAALKKVGFDAISACETFEESVIEARNVSDFGDVILLSPACASWDMFNSFEERGDLFKKVVNDFE